MDAKRLVRKWTRGVLNREPCDYLMEDKIMEWTEEMRIEYPELTEQVRMERADNHSGVWWLWSDELWAQNPELTDQLNLCLADSMFPGNWESGKFWEREPGVLLFVAKGQGVLCWGLYVHPFQLFNPRKGWLHWRVLAARIQRSRGVPISLEEQGQGEFILSFPRWYRTRPEFVDEYVRFCDLLCPQAEAHRAFAALPFNMCTKQLFNIVFVNEVRAMFKRHRPRRCAEWLRRLWRQGFGVWLVSLRFHFLVSGRVLTDE
jgi:hypothetical protein